MLFSKGSSRHMGALSVLLLELDMSMGFFCIVTWLTV